MSEQSVSEGSARVSRRALAGLFLIFALFVTGVFAQPNADAQNRDLIDSLAHLDDMATPPSDIGRPLPIPNDPPTSPEHFSDRPIISDVDLRCTRYTISVSLTVSARGPVTGSLEWISNDQVGESVALLPTGTPGRWTANLSYPGTLVGVLIKVRTATGGALYHKSCPDID